MDEGTLLEAIDRFHAAHEQEFTYRLANPVELVNFHIVVTARVGRSELPRLPRGEIDPEIALTGARIVDFDEAGEVETRSYDLSGLGPGMRILGPAVVEDGTAAVLVPPGRRAEMDDFGNIHSRDVHVMTKERRFDPYEQEIIRNALVAVGDEMFDALARTSMSPIIYEALDYSVGRHRQPGRSDRAGGTERPSFSA